MDKKEYSRIVVNLINKRFEKNDIQNIKRNATLKETLKFLSIMYNNTKISKFLQDKIEYYDDIIYQRFPHIFSGQFREDTLIKEIEGELRFLTGQVALEERKIKTFLQAKNEFECLFMSGKFELAIKKIEKFEKENGFSIWSLDCHILSLSYFNVYQADMFCDNIINDCTNLSLKTYINIGRYRFLKDVTMPYFKAQFDDYLRKYDEEEENSNFKEAFKRYLIGNVDISRGMDLYDIRYKLIMANYLPLYDRYIILEKVLGWFCSESVYGNKKFEKSVLECASLLKEKINIPFWANICNLMGDSSEIIINEEKIIINNALELLCLKKYNEAYNYCVKMLEKIPNSFLLMNILSKCGKDIKKSTPNYELAWFVRKLYLKKEKDTEFAGTVGLCDVYERIYSHFSFGNNLGVIIENETRPIMLQGKKSYVNALVNLNFTPSKLAFFLKEENIESFFNEYKEKIGNLYFSDWQIATYSEANKKILSLYLCDDTSYVLNGLKNKDSDYTEKWNELDALNGDEINIQMCRSFLLKKQFDLAVKDGKLLEAIEIYLKSYFISQWMVLKIDYDKINEKITRKIKSFLENSLSYCLYAYITHFELYKGENISETVVNSYKKIVENNGGSITEFVIPEEKLEKQKMIFFLRHICTYEGMRRVKVGMSLVQELYNDRLQVIDKILPYYKEICSKEDIYALSKERKEVLNKIEYLDIDKCINKGKINTSWIAFSDEARGAIMSIYNMYKNMAENYTLSAYVNAFALVKKDYVQEINRILSITIRHGILEGELLRFVKKGKITEDMDGLSPINSREIRKFYKKVYKLIDELLDEYIISTYKYESETKLLLYVDEELLAKSFEELSENIEGPEDIEDAFVGILNVELEKRLLEWRDKICNYIEQELRTYLYELNLNCDNDLRTNINNISDLLGGEIEKLKEWFAVTENREVTYRLVTLGDALEQEGECVKVDANINKDIIVTGNVINFLYTIIRELIWNAEKYSGYKGDSEEFYINIVIYMEEENIVFIVTNNIEKNITLQTINENIQEIEDIINTVDKLDTKIFNRKDIHEGKSGYKKIVKLLKRSYDGHYQIGVRNNEHQFIVEMSIALEALL